MHGGAGGIGNFAIQLAKALGARVFTTAGSAEKLELCAVARRRRAINYHDEDFVEVVKEDSAAPTSSSTTWARSTSGATSSALATEGRLVVIGMQGGTKGELDLGVLLRKRGAVIATTLRARPTEEKAAICASVVEHVWPLIGEGKVRSFVHEEVPLEEAPRAHALMESGAHSGKILLTSAG